jgi:hypothetical protein
VTAQVSTQGDRLRIEFPGWDAVWTLRRRVDLPLATVTGVQVESRAAALAAKPLLRMPGTELPGVIVAGTYRSPRSRPQLWCVRRARAVLTIDLADPAPFGRIVLEVPDPAATARDLQAKRPY